MDTLRALSLAAAGGPAHDPWITTLAAALDGVDAAEAAWQPEGVERSIAQITLHARAWTDWATAMLDGRGDTDVTNWPEPDAWEADRAATLASLDAYQRAVDALPDTERIGAVLSIAVHNAHHAGQIVKLREAYARGPR